MKFDECRARFGSARRAHLATVGADQRPHIVPVVFDLTGDEVVVAVDHKPKRTTALRRLRNIGENPAVTFLVDAYSPDWDELWWVRADGRAVVVDSGRVHAEAIERLSRRYVQYREVPPTGPVIVARITHWSGWAARPPALHTPPW